MFAFAAGMLCPRFAGAHLQAAERHGNLARYAGRMAARYFPDMRKRRLQRRGVKSEQNARRGWGFRPLRFGFSLP